MVCNLNRFRIRINWTNSVSQLHEFGLDDIRDATVRQKLKWVLSDPERLKPGKTSQALTEQAAAEFADWLNLSGARVTNDNRELDSPRSPQSPAVPAGPPPAGFLLPPTSATIGGQSGV